MNIYRVKARIGKKEVVIETTVSKSAAVKLCLLY